MIETHVSRDQLAPPTASPADHPEPPLPRRRGRQNRLLWLTAPSMVWYLVFTIGPLAGMFVIAFLDWKGLIYTPSFAGLDNFARVFSDPTFYDALRNSAVQVAVAIPVMLPLAFMLGYFLNSKPRGHRVLSVLFFTPGLISISIKATMFYGVFSPTGGLNGLLDVIGLDSATTAWLANPATALGAIIFVDLWSGIGWTAVLFASRLASVPTEILEAADLDGAGRVRKMWQIAFPMIKDYFATLTMLQFLWTLFTSAALILLLTSGGPGTSTTTLSYLVYAKAFSQQDLGYSQAVGIILLVVGVLGMVLIRRLLRTKI
ncbi:carbohydrate ABC transporter permease [Compostimonas suwonensis]|uniref:Multiple sugar transport system permease protein n=1 Tax=Compostimonas suwonensis TaxID=1048394 RepID=A0A2M9BC50_9MICO|nr:sugar ABC transporter permease [Compostimonas suwonensis]PJJ55535.1 multiple sugar transport system permease protein [Compostimonas suwonensis]